jgi:hypothetical protein
MAKKRRATPPKQVSQLPDVVSGLEHVGKDSMFVPSPPAEQGIQDSGLSFANSNSRPVASSTSTVSPAVTDLGGFNSSAFDSTAFNGSSRSPIPLSGPIGGHRVSRAPPPPPPPKFYPHGGASSPAPNTDIVSSELRAPARKSRQTASTAIGRAVLKNRVEIDLIGISFILLIDERLESLRSELPNSDEALAARDSAIASCEDLRRRVEAFLGATSKFAHGKAKEASAVKAASSFAAGIGDWWSRRHVQICDKAVDMGLFGIGFGMCLLGGVDADFAAAIPGAMVGGKPVIEVIKAFAKRPRSE